MPARRNVVAVGVHSRRGWKARALLGLLTVILVEGCAPPPERSMYPNCLGSHDCRVGQICVSQLCSVDTASARQNRSDEAAGWQATSSSSSEVGGKKWASASTSTEGAASTKFFERNISGSHELGEYHALVIGNNAYQHLVPLLTPRNDARGVRFH